MLRNALLVSGQPSVHPSSRRQGGVRWAPPSGRKDLHLLLRVLSAACPQPSALPQGQRNRYAQGYASFWSSPRPRADPCKATGACPEGSPQFLSSPRGPRRLLSGWHCSSVSSYVCFSSQPLPSPGADPRNAPQENVLHANLRLSICFPRKPDLQHHWWVTLPTCSCGAGTHRADTGVQDPLRGEKRQ